MRELFSIFLVENHALRKTIKNFEKLLEKTVVGWKFLAISLLKFDRFLKVRIYSERGYFGASSYAKKSILIYLRKVEFSEGGSPLNITSYDKLFSIYNDCTLFSSA
jgi:hypothetical protein